MGNHTRNRISLRVSSEDRRKVTPEELREHQLIAKEALDEIKTICEKNDIPYYLLAGSCLGAVRHKGFIPWDDDIDIGILQKDYARFEEALSESLSDRFSWISNNTNKTYPRLFGKVLYQGTGCVDCFQLVKTADHLCVRKIHRFMKELWLKVYLRTINSYWPGENRLFYAISVVIAAFMTREKAMAHIRNNERRFEGSDRRYCLNINSVYSTEKETLESKWLFPEGKVVFEGSEYSTVNDTDAYLTHLYGDYMTPPPQEKRRQGHIDYVF